MLVSGKKKNNFFHWNQLSMQSSVAVTYCDCIWLLSHHLIFYSVQPQLPSTGESSYSIKVSGGNASVGDHSVINVGRATPRWHTYTTNIIVLWTIRKYDKVKWNKRNTNVKRKESLVISPLSSIFFILN